MPDASFSNFFNTAQRFGLNIKVPERTLRQVGKTAENVAGGAIEPLLNYLEENEKVFSGDVTHELNKLRSEAFNTTLIMQADDEKTNGIKPSFNMLF